MIYDTLLKFQELKETEELSVIDVKIIIQKHAFDQVMRTGKGIGVIEAYTGFGKMFVGIHAIERYRAKFEEEYVNIVVPTLKLKLDWEEKIKSILNIDVATDDKLNIYVINTYTMTKNEHLTNCGFCIVDEIHHATGDSEFFSNVIRNKNYEFFLGLSATLSDSDKQLLYDNDIPVCFSIDISEGRKLELVPRFEIYNVGVTLSAKEKADYEVNTDIYENCKDFFLQVTSDVYSICLFLSTNNQKNRSFEYENKKFYKKDLLDYISVRTGVDRNIVSKRAILYNVALRKRGDILKKSEQKEYFGAALIHECNLQKIVFCSSIEQVRKFTKQFEESDDVFSWHSKKAKKVNIKDFEEFKVYKKEVKGNNVVRKGTLLTVKALDEGVSVDTLELGINLSFTSKVRQLKQRLGRIVRDDKDNPDKLPILINVYCEPFDRTTKRPSSSIFDDSLIYPTDYNNIKNLTRNMLNVKWFPAKQFYNNINEILKGREQTVEEVEKNSKKVIEGDLNTL